MEPDTMQTASVKCQRTAKFGVYATAIGGISTDSLDAMPAPCSMSSKELFEKVYELISYERAKDASLDARATMNADQKRGLTYGEVVFESMQTIFKRLRRLSFDGLSTEGGLFYDLGSGSGRPVIMAASLHPFSKCVGIEILPCLHELASEAKVQWDAIVFDSVYEHPEVEFVLGSILAPEVCDWTDGDVVISNCTAFHDELFEGMARMARGLRKGAFMITLTAPLDDPNNFDMLEELRLDMSWGMADVFIHRRN